jgi:hypothetical protein
MDYPYLLYFLTQNAKGTEKELLRFQTPPLHTMIEHYLYVKIFGPHFPVLKNFWTPSNATLVNDQRIEPRLKVEQDCKIFFNKILFRTHGFKSYVRVFLVNQLISGSHIVPIHEF